MKKINAANERIKRDFFRYLREALGRDEATIDAVAEVADALRGMDPPKDFKRFIASRPWRSKRSWPPPLMHAQASG